MPFSIIRNDITKVKADAIVNTANPAVAIGDGVDAAIYKAAGESRLFAARKEIGVLEPGEVGITPAFDLDAKYIIHASGPWWQGGNHGEEELLRQCYDKSLALAADYGCESIAFPLLATGTYGFPKELGIQIAVDAFTEFLSDHEMEITLVVFGGYAYHISGRIFDDVQSFIDEEYVSEALEEEYSHDGIPNQFPEVQLSMADSYEDDQADSEMPYISHDDFGDFDIPETPRDDFGDFDIPEIPCDDFGDFDISEPASEESEDYEIPEVHYDACISADASIDTDSKRDKKSNKKRSIISGAIEAISSVGAAKARESERTESHSAKQPTPPKPSASMQAYTQAPTLSPKPISAMTGASMEASMKTPTLEETLKGIYTDSFSKHLQQLINKKGLKNSEVYTSANISKQYFSKLLKGQVNPSKEKVLSLAVGLRLNMDETVDFLRLAGYALSPISQTDVIVEFFIKNRDYSVMKIDIVLFDYGLDPLSKG